METGLQSQGCPSMYRRGREQSGMLPLELDMCGTQIAGWGSLFCGDLHFTMTSLTGLWVVSPPLSALPAELGWPGATSGRVSVAAGLTCANRLTICRACPVI